MSYAKAVFEWANKSGMADEFKEADGSGNVGFNMTFGENQVPVLLRGFDDTKMLCVNVFIPFVAKKDKYSHLLQVFNVIHDSTAYGRFILSEKGEITFNHNMALADVFPDASVIEEMVAKAYVVINFYIGGIADVALEKMSFDSWKDTLPKE